MKCVYQCAVLRRICEQYPSFLEKVDVITGVSAGSVPAAAIALGYELGGVERMMAGLFERTFGHAKHALGVRGAQYSNELLYAVGDTVFGDVRLGDVECRLCIPSYAIDDGRRGSCVELHNNFVGVEERGPLLTDVCVGSGAAPGYFKSASGRVDGGVAQNEPFGAVYPLVVGGGGLGVSKEDVVVLSLGSGRTGEEYVDSEAYSCAGVVGWTARLIDVAVESRKAHADIEGVWELGARFKRYDPRLPGNVKLDDYKSLDAVRMMGAEADLRGVLEWVGAYWDN